MNFKQVFIIALITSLVFGMGWFNAHVEGTKCEDIKGEEKWDGEGHGDNNPSEKKFYNEMDDKTFCQVTEDIDHMDKKGAIREDTKHDWDWFSQTIAYQSAAEETQDCLKHKYNLPDDGKKNLEAYEFLDCTY